MHKKYFVNRGFFENPVCYNDTVLIQLGRLYCMPEAIIQKHAHAEYYELTVVTGGEGIVLTNDVATAVQKGDIYLSFPGDFHEIRSSADKPLKYDFFAFNTKNEKIKSELYGITANVQDHEQRIFRDEKVEAAIATAIAEIISEQAYYEDVLGVVFEQILLYVVRHFRTAESKLRRIHAGSADELCYSVMHYIDTHIYELQHLTVLAEKLNYNYSYLSDLFKKTTGNTIALYYQTRRLEAAKLLLDERKFKVKQIAEMLNYASPYAFSKAFKLKFGISPKHYLQHQEG